MFRNIDGAIRDGFTPFHPRDPSIPLRSTRDDSCFCHLERSDSVVERSRPIGAFSLTIHTRSAQPAKDKRLSAVLRPGWLRTAGAKRRIDRLSCRAEGRRPAAETSQRSGIFTLAIRMGSRLFHPRDPSTVLGVTDRNGYAWLGVTKKCTYFVVNREKCTTFGTSDPPERRDSRCRYVNVRNLPV